MIGGGFIWRAFSAAECSLARALRRGRSVRATRQRSPYLGMSPSRVQRGGRGASPNNFPTAFPDAEDLANFRPVRAASAISGFIRATLLGGMLFCGATRAIAAPPDFNRDVRPILAAKCYACHGPDADARKAGLRLDNLAGATAKLKSGVMAITPGNLEGSALLSRVANSDPELRMPPKGEPLPPKERDVMARWIESGAQYFEPWAFRSINARPAPRVRDANWCFGEIDQFVLATRQAVQLPAPAKDVEAAALLRRLSFDLRGLPPDATDIRAFVARPTEESYTMLVDRYLADPAYGERWGRHWLDLAKRQRGQVQTVD